MSEQFKKGDLVVYAGYTDKIEGVTKTYFGQTQEPKIDDYADNVDTFDFLLKLN